MTDTGSAIPPAVRAKLEAARVARLATVDAENTPHLIPICFVFDGSVLYSGIDRKPKRVAAQQLTRLRNIEATPEVAFLIDEYDDDWDRLWYVLVRGKAALVTAKDAEHKLAMARLKAKYPKYEAGMLAEDALILRITPDRITSWGKL
ncbi:MAG TPA: TIGR03668 family PPOX class F420-dependent oxidoreductase [Candidatus Sulfotelmatobacter sp.]|nr:TIGR03668 family PPOX class F420-dependent oxidoreductase [Candidatus Sulfotelmatobacter sp.]